MYLLQFSAVRLYGLGTGAEIATETFLPSVSTTRGWWCWWKRAAPEVVHIIYIYTGLIKTQYSVWTWNIQLTDWNPGLGNIWGGFGFAIGIMIELSLFGDPAPPISFWYLGKLGRPWNFSTSIFYNECDVHIGTSEKTFVCRLSQIGRGSPSFFFGIVVNTLIN